MICQKNNPEGFGNAIPLHLKGKPNAAAFGVGYRPINFDNIFISAANERQR